MLLIWLITHDVNFDHLAKVVFAQFFHCLSPLSVLCPLKASHRVQPTLQGAGWGCVNLCLLDRVTAYIIWNFSEKKICLSSSHYLFNHLSISVWTHVCFCILSIMIKPGLFILMLKLFHLSPLGDWLLSSFDTFPFFCFWSSSLLPGITSTLGSSFVFSAPLLESVISSRVPISFHWRPVFRNQALAVWLLLAEYPWR